MNLDVLLKSLPALFGALFLAILFIQSGLDKIFDWKGNLGWLTGHFEKTFIGRMVPVMLGTLTAMELTTGILSAAGVFYFLLAGSTVVIFWAAALAAASFCALFFGQRLAKDYPGAAVLVPYFLLAIAIIYLTNPYAR